MFNNQIKLVLCGCLALAILPVVNTAASSPSSAPKLTHVLRGQEKCLTCHAVRTGVKAMPEDHRGRTVDLCLLCHATKEGNGVAQSLPEKAQTEFCLRCHGPFDALMKRTVAYVTDQGEKVNPHVYVPHQAGKITACGECHKVHALPVIQANSIEKTNLQYCYSACHHENDFTPCTQCHKDRK